MKVLIVDDEEMIRGVLKEYVEFEGGVAYEAADGMQAVKLCRENDFDIILMDIMMPRLDGFSAVKEIKKIKNIPHGGLQDEIFYIIIVLTTTVVAKKLGSLKVCFNSIFYLKERLPRK